MGAYLVGAGAGALFGGLFVYWLGFDRGWVACTRAWREFCQCKGEVE